MKIYTESGKFVRETELDVLPNVKYVEFPVIINKCLTKIPLKVTVMANVFTGANEKVLICNDEFRDCLQLTR